MSKNDIFNFRRFGKYFASDFKTCTSNYGLSLLTISILIPVALYALSVIFSVIFKISEYSVVPNIGPYVTFILPPDTLNGISI